MVRHPVEQKYSFHVCSRFADRLANWRTIFQIVYFLRLQDDCDPLTCCRMPSAKTEWTAERHRMKEKVAALEEAEQKAKAEVIRIIAINSQV